MFKKKSQKSSARLIELFFKMSQLGLDTRCIIISKVVEGPHWVE